MGQYWCSMNEFSITAALDLIVQLGEDDGPEVVMEAEGKDDSIRSFKAKNITLNKSPNSTIHVQSKSPSSKEELEWHQNIPIVDLIWRLPSTVSSSSESKTKLSPMGSPSPLGKSESKTDLECKTILSCLNYTQVRFLSGIFFSGLLVLTVEPTATLDESYLKRKSYFLNEGVREFFA